MTEKKRTATVWITGDQCSVNNSALLAADKKRDTVLMVESIARGMKLKYHKKKLVLIYSVMRHFAAELEADGWNVDYHKETPDFKSAVEAHIKKFKPNEFLIMQQSEWGTIDNLAKLVHDLPMKVYPHCNFISTAEEFDDLHTTETSRVTMERFYRLMRKKTNLLMEGDHPVGSEWNFDKSNRQPPDSSLHVHKLTKFPPDKITKEVIEMVEKHFSDHPGTTDDWLYAVTRKDARKAAKEFFDHKLADFGPHQDAMLDSEPFLNHSILSPYINTCLLHPLELAREAEKRYYDNEAPLGSVEGYIRQLIGWREFMWRVYWRNMPEFKERNGLDAHHKLPDFFWTGDTKMRCLADTVETVKQHGYAHHIARLMLLGNFALIAGIEPLEANNWFHAMFVDGYDWVMVTNVIGMSLHADGGYVGTKPYAASANYINKMSNYCRKCEFDQKKAVGKNACPFNSLYWDFLLRNEERFSNNQRMAMIMRGLSSKPPEWKRDIVERVEELRKSNWRS